MIKNYQEEIIKQIGFYQNKCVSNAKNPEEFKILIKECEEKVRIWIDFLDKGCLEDNEIENLLGEAKNMQKELNKSIKSYEETIFDQKKLIFLENGQIIKPEIIGNLSRIQANI
jgi:hypothetical protein